MNEKKKKKKLISAQTELAICNNYTYTIKKGWAVSSTYVIPQLLELSYDYSVFLWIQPVLLSILN